MVLSNLAPKVAAKMPLAETCFGALKAGNGGDWKKRVNIICRHMTFIYTYVKLFAFNVFVFMFLNEMPKWSVSLMFDFLTTVMFLLLKDSYCR